MGTTSICREISIPITGTIIALTELILVLNSNFYVRAFLVATTLLIVSLIFLNYRF